MNDDMVHDNHGGRCVAGRDPITSALLGLVLMGACLAALPLANAQGNAQRAQGNYVAFAKGRIDVAGGMVRLAAPRDGVIHSLHVDEGADVKKGALLAQLDDRQVQLQLAAARNELREIETRIQPLRIKLAAAERELARIEPLMASQAVSRAERDDKRDLVSLIKAEIESANAQAAASGTRIKLAALEVDLRAVRAPMDGRIIKRYARAGDTAHPGATPLFLLAPAAARVARVDLEDRFVHAVSPGMNAEVVVEADESRVLKGKVTRVGQAFGVRPPTDDPAEKVDVRSVELVVTLDTVNPLPLIGQRVLVRIPSANAVARP